MEIIFSLILLIGFGINSHRYEAKKQELPKQVVSSYIQQEISSNEVSSKQEFKVDTVSEFKEVAVKSEATINKTTKGKYISVRINDGNG